MAALLSDTCAASAPLACKTTQARAVTLRARPQAQRWVLFATRAARVGAFATCFWAAVRQRRRLVAAVLRADTAPCAGAADALARGAQAARSRRSRRWCALFEARGRARRAAGWRGAGALRCRVGECLTSPLKAAQPQPKTVRLPPGDNVACAAERRLGAAAAPLRCERTQGHAATLRARAPAQRWVLTSQSRFGRFLLVKQPPAAAGCAGACPPPRSQHPQRPRLPHLCLPEQSVRPWAATHRPPSSGGPGQ
jgi:hypothetical protein